MRFLITGAAGFIATHVVERLLKDEHQVIGVDNLNDYYDVRIKDWRLKRLKAYPGFTFFKEDVANLKAMKKGFNLMGGGYEKALANLRKFHIRLYATFIFGYDEDTAESFTEAVEFAKHHRFYIAAFNHLTPFPGTPLYQRLEEQRRLLYESWWLDPDYSYNKSPFAPLQLTPEQLQKHCVRARADFYSWRNILRRSVDQVNRSDGFMFRNFFMINGLLRSDVHGRDYYPLGDDQWRGQYLPVSG